MRSGRYFRESAEIPESGMCLRQAFALTCWLFAKFSSARSAFALVLDTMVKAQSERFNEKLLRRQTERVTYTFIDVYKSWHTNDNDKTSQRKENSSLLKAASRASAASVLYSINSMSSEKSEVSQKTISFISEMMAT